jgi:hypothetical protein
MYRFTKKNILDVKKVGPVPYSHGAKKFGIRDLTNFCFILANYCKCAVKLATLYGILDVSDF